jgi:lysophospholipase L1-like esterase
MLSVSLLVGALLLPGALNGEEKANSAVVAQPRDANWMKRHDLINTRVKETPDSQVLFIGDSITQGWEGAGKKAWEAFAEYKPLNLGIGGDRTQHVLWRLENGNIAGLKPKAAVIMIGTNNSNGADNTAEEIAAGITAIVTKLRTELKDTKLLVLGVFPRGPQPNPQREKIAAINAIIAKLDDGKYVHFLDIGEKFLEADKSLSKEVMPDFLHLSPKGYEIWVEAITPKLKELTK